MDDAKLQLWRLVSDLSVEDAAILIAGGDPSDLDYESDSFGNEYSVKRTTGHSGFLAVFTSLTNAIRKGHIQAHLAFRAKSGGVDPVRSAMAPNGLRGETWVMSKSDLSRLRDSLEGDPFGDTPLDGADGIRLEVEPDWTRATIDVEDLKAWLRSRGFTTGFFFPSQDESAPDDFMNPDHEHFAPELALAVSAWRGLASEQKFPRGTKPAIESWIDANPNAWLGDGEVSAAAKERIATLVNWRKSGGAPTTGG